VRIYPSTIRVDKLSHSPLSFWHQRGKAKKSHKKPNGWVTHFLVCMCAPRTWSPPRYVDSVGSAAVLLMVIVPSTARRGTPRSQCNKLVSRSTFRHHWEEIKVRVVCLVWTLLPKNLIEACASKQSIRGGRRKARVGRHAV
jgi:hypothetical protein